MKQVGYEVTARKPVCVDFPDGRSISYRPGMRFKALPTNPAVRRLLRVREIRKLAHNEPVPPTPIKLGLPPRQKAVMKARREIELAKQRSLAKLKESKTAPPEIEMPKPIPKPKDED